MEKPSQLCFLCISKRKTDEMWSCGVAAGIGVMLGKNKTGNKAHSQIKFYTFPVFKINLIQTKILNHV
jgi:hypothetical protein